MANENATRSPDVAACADPVNCVLRYPDSFLSCKYIFFVGSTANGLTETTLNGSPSSVIVPLVTTYSSYASPNNANGGAVSDQFVSLQPGSIKRTYPPATSSPAPANSGFAVSSGQSGEGNDKKIKLDLE